MKKSIESSQRTHESQIADMRSKHNQQVEQLNEELETFRKVRLRLSAFVLTLRPNKKYLRLG